MSGGRFDYKQYELAYIADEIEHVIIKNYDNSLNEWGDTVGKHYNEATLERLREATRYLRVAQVYANRIDYLLSSDDDEDSFHTRLELELSEVSI
jgi:hypothetical protein